MVGVVCQGLECLVISLGGVTNQFLVVCNPSTLQSTFSLLKHAFRSYYGYGAGKCPAGMSVLTLSVKRIIIPPFLAAIHPGRTYEARV